MPKDRNQVLSTLTQYPDISHILIANTMTWEFVNNPNAPAGLNFQIGDDKFQRLLGGPLVAAHFQLSDSYDTPYRQTQQLNSLLPFRRLRDAAGDAFQG